MARKPATEAEVPADATEVMATPRSYGVNAFHLLGRMPADPALRYTPAGTAVLNLGVATNVNGVAEFHDVVAWEKTAEIIGQYGRKGREIFVKGRITSRACMIAAAHAVGPGPHGGSAEVSGYAPARGRASRRSEPPATRCTSPTTASEVCTCSSPRARAPSVIDGRRVLENCQC